MGVYIYIFNFIEFVIEYLGEWEWEWKWGVGVVIFVLYYK